MAPVVTTRDAKPVSSSHRLSRTADTTSRTIIGCGGERMKHETFSTGILSLATLVGLWPLAAQAPSGAAALSGTVRDEHQGTIFGARVTLTEKSKGFGRESFSDTGGSFLFPSVNTGIHAVRVTKEGFNTYQMDDLKIEVGQQAALDITLQIGGVRTVVNVSSADKEALDTKS